MVADNVRKETLARIINRRRFLQGIGVGAGSLALGSTIACGSTASPTPSGSTPAATSGAQPTAQPLSGGTLTVAHNADIVPTLMINGANPANYFMMNAILNRLMHYPADRLEWQPELAESWKYSADFTSLTIKLRSGVKYHTGRPFTSADVKWNVERGADPKIAFQAMTMCQWVQKIETPDPLTVTLTFDKARPTFLDVFEFLTMGDSETYQEGLDGKRIIGTGPFMFKEWQPGDHYTVVRNPDYWEKGKPYLDGMTVKIMPEAQTRLINLQTGAMDVAHAIEPRDAKALQNDKNYNLVYAENTNGIWYLGIDIKVAPFGDKRVRQAVSYLLDRQRIFDTQLMFGQPTQLPWDKTSPAYDANLAHKFDYNPTKAKELLAQAGVGSNVSVTLYPNQGNVEPGPMMEMVQAELAKLGWKADIVKIPNAEMTQKLRSGTFGGLWITNGGFMQMGPSALFTLAQYVRVPNASNYDTPEFRKLIDDLNTTTDQAQLKKLYDQANQLLMDECFILPIASVTTVEGTTQKVKGLKLNRSGWPILADAWKTK